MPSPNIHKVAQVLIVISAAVFLFCIAGLLVLALSSRMTIDDRDVVPQDDATDDTGQTPDEPVDTTSQGGVAPLYITTMTHMEGIFADDKRENVFTKHVNDIRWAMDLFDEYGAKLTIESEEAFAKANTKWGINILKEIVDRGHGVGSHADFGYSISGRNSMSLDELTAASKELKALVDNLVGSENNLGLSGGIGQSDWVIAAAEAGYEYKDGVTGVAYLSMSESARATGWTDEYIREEGYHETIPPEFEENIYPLPLADATDLDPDENPRIIVMGGVLGELASLDEGRVNCFPNCVYTTADNDVVIAAIKEADRIRDRSRVVHLDVHIPAKLLTQENEEVLRELLSAIRAYVNDGTVMWATQLESYKGYVEWNK